MLFVITTTEIALAEYTVTADSETAARERLLSGSWDGWRDLGHDDVEIIDVRRADSAGSGDHQRHQGDDHG